MGEGKNAATANVEYTIARAKLTIDSVTVAPKTYNGSADAEITKVTFTGLKNSEALTKGGDYEVSGAFNSANVKAASKVTGTVTLKDTPKAKNYELPTTTYDVSATIAQAATPRGSHRSDRREGSAALHRVLGRSPRLELGGRCCLNEHRWFSELQCELSR